MEHAVYKYNEKKEYVLNVFCDVKDALEYCTKNNWQYRDFFGNEWSLKIRGIEDHMADRILLAYTA